MSAASHNAVSVVEQHSRENVETVVVEVADSESSRYDPHLDWDCSGTSELVR